MKRSLAWVFVVVTGASTTSWGCSSDEGESVDATACPATIPSFQAYGMAAPDCSKGAPADACSYALECESGPVDVALSCNENYWFVAGTTCSQPYDHCSGAAIRCLNGVWELPRGTDAPTACPGERPEAGAACSQCKVCTQTLCGYWCDDGATWTVATCNGATWELDGACGGP